MNFQPHDIVTVGDFVLHLALFLMILFNWTLIADNWLQNRKARKYVQEAIEKNKKAMGQLDLANQELTLAQEMNLKAQKTLQEAEEMRGQVTLKLT